MADITVRDAMTKDLITVQPDENVIELAKKMRDNDIGSMIVCEDNKLVGLITSEDLIKRVLIPNKDPSKLKAKVKIFAPLRFVSPFQRDHLSDAKVTK